jgi:hypothetical protein
MSSPKEFRENAEECFGWARTARTERERKIFLQMADAWLQAALLSERPIRAIGEHDQLSEGASITSSRRDTESQGSSSPVPPSSAK